MRKITFITLMMILGMSSVSFGKSYLCTPYHYLLDDLKSRGKGEFRIIPTKVLLEHTRFMVKTEGDEIKMLEGDFDGLGNKTIKITLNHHYFITIH